MSALGRRARRGWSRLGWPGAAGLLLLAAAGALWRISWDTAPGPAQRAPASQERPAPGRPVPLPVSVSVPWPVVSAHQQASDLAGLLALAERHGVHWPAADYRLAPAAASASAADGGDALIWQIDVPLRGQAAQLEAFVLAVPRELPHARIERLSLAQGASAPGTLQADARLRLHYRRHRP